MLLFVLIQINRIKLSKVSCLLSVTAMVLTEKLDVFF